jgi:glucose-6-phosphate dehydrogenase assembly protein OpcA
MAKSVTTLLSRRSTPDSIEEDLAILWRDAAREGPVARAVMTNLVVYCERPSPERVDLVAPIEGVPIEDVAVRCPARVIVLHHGAKAIRSGPVDATISILLFGPPGMRTGVEEIALRSTCSDDSLPSIVRHFLLGDIPTTVWWTEDLSRVEPVGALVGLGRQFLYDSRLWRNIRAGIAALARLASRSPAPDLVDLNWRRLRPMRQALVQALVPGARGAAEHVMPMHVSHRPGDAALAWLLAGWFCARLGLRAGTDWPITIEEARNHDEMLGVSLGNDVTASMTGHQVVVRYATSRAPFSMTVPHHTAADAIAMELRTPAGDDCLRETVAALAERFTSISSRGSS